MSCADLIGPTTCRNAPLSSAQSSKNFDKSTKTRRLVVIIFILGMGCGRRVKQAASCADYMSGIRGYLDW